MKRDKILNSEPSYAIVHSGFPSRVSRWPEQYVKIVERMKAKE